MKTCKQVFIAAGIATVGFIGVSAHADVVEISGFTAEFTEGFDDMSGGWKNSAFDVFEGQGSVGRSGQAGGLIVTSSWSYHSVVNPLTGGLFMGSPGGSVEYVFEDGIAAFGGFFSTNSLNDNGMAYFSNEVDSHIGSSEIAVPLEGEWEWSGWSADETIFKVVIEGNHSSKGFVMVDDMRIHTSIPAPGALAVMAIGLGGLGRRRRC